MTEYNIQDLFSLGVGQELRLSGQGVLANEAVRRDNGLRLRNEAGVIVVMRVEAFKENVRGLLCSQMDAYAGEITVGHEISYVRATVSAYNKKNGTAFKVTRRGNEAVIYLDIEGKESITQAEYDAVKASYQRKLDALRAKIVTHNEMM